MMRLTQRAEEAPKPVPVAEPVSSGLVEGLDLEEYLRVIWRRRKVILATVAVLMALGYVVISSLAPHYTAYVLVEINPRQTQVVDFEAVLSGLPADTETIQTELRIIQSRKIARRVISRLSLNKDPEFNPVLRPVGTIHAWRDGIADWLYPLPRNDGDDGTGASPEKVGFIAGIFRGLSDFVRPTKSQPASEDARIQLEDEQVISAFLKGLTAEPEGRSRVVRISFEATDPAKATAVANTVADFYIVAQLEAKFEAAKRATTWLNERVDQLREEVDSKEQAIEEYRTAHGLLQGGGTATLTDEQVTEINRQHIMERARLAEAQARLRQVNNLLGSSNDIETAGDVLNSPLILQLRGEESRIERQIAELAEEYGDLHPRMITAREGLRDLRAKIGIEIDRIVQGLRNEVAVARARVASLASSLESAKSEVADRNRSEVALRALEREATASRTLLENLLQRTKQTVSQESFQQADASVLSYAATPDKPSFPKKNIIFPLIFLVASGLGVVLAFIIEKLDLGFRSAEQLTKAMGVSSLGLVPVISKLATIGKSPPDYILENPGSAYGEAIRSLYTNLLLSDVVQRPKVVLLTSALPREGKTSVTISLARMLASVGHRVIIVDCDLRRPRIHKELGIEPGPGLTDCLMEGLRVEDVVQEDKASGAHILRAGTPVHSSPEQLDSGLMQKLLRSLARQYDLVLLDSAPILAVSDTLFVARLADKTVFLVRWGRTRRAAATMALRQVQAAQADVAGVLLTMVHVKSHAEYGYGDSGAYHGELKKYYTG